MATKFTPLHDRLLVRRVEEAGASRDGIIIPDSAKDKPQEGEVISVGKGKTNDEGKLFPLAVKEGDRILFGKYSGTEIKIGFCTRICKIAHSTRLSEKQQIRSSWRPSVAPSIANNSDPDNHARVVAVL